MQNTLILMVSHRGVSPETRTCIQATECPSYLEILGNANLCKARSIAFDKALEATEHTSIDMILCVDDDMTFTRTDAQRLVDLARAAEWPTSAMAVKRDGGLAMRPAPAEAPGDHPYWYTGLACMAIPRAELARVALELDQAPKPSGIRQWCQTGEHPFFPGEWVGEDVWFCSHWGGVEVAPIAFGHLKWIPLLPDDATIAAVLGAGQN